MKKLLGIVVLVLLLSGNAYAQTFFFEKCNEPTGNNLSHATINILDDSINYKMATLSDGKIFFDGDTNISQINDLDLKMYNLEQIEKITSRSTRWLEIMSYHQVKKMKKKHTKYYAWHRIELTFYPKLKKITSKMNILEPDNAKFKKKLEKYWSSKIPWERSVTATCEKVTYTKKIDDKDQAISASSGTAFFITDAGHIITNFHVIETCNNESKIFYQNNEIDVKLLAKDEYLDLALLKAEVSNNKFITISNKAPRKLQRIIAAGYPFGKYLSDDMKFTSGIVSSLKGIKNDSTRLQIDAALNPGNSGGPIVDENTGELVAVAVAGLRKDVTEAVNYGIKASSVKNFLESNQIDTSTFSKKFSTEDIAKHLENTVLYTFCN